MLYNDWYQWYNILPREVHKEDILTLKHRNLVAEEWDEWGVYRDGNLWWQEERDEDPIVESSHSRTP